MEDNEEAETNNNLLNAYIPLGILLILVIWAGVEIVDLIRHLIMGD